MNRQILRWHPYDTPEALHRAARAAILSAADEAIRDRGLFHVVLAGGTTPRAIYGTLRDAPTDWAAWRVWYGDERCVPADDDARNSRMAGAAWLDHVPLPAAVHFAIPAERGPVEGARAYAELLRDVGAFDLVLLGLGEDAHTASLFPGDPPGTEPDAPDALPVTDAPKPPPERVSLSAARLSNTRRLLFLVEGAGKRAAVEAWRGGHDVPAASIMPPEGADVLIDAALLA